jgi:DNA ligase (NAD+)
MSIIDQLKEYDKLYYNTGTSPLSDDEYDALKEMAKLQFPDDPYFQVVGAPVESSNKIKFDFVMGSLEKFKPDTVHKWLEKVYNKTLRITPKLDGASIICKFEKGKLIWAATRGDGYEGVNITRKVAHMDFGCNANVSCTLRGEILLSGDLYKKIGLSNRRNGVVGIIGRKDDDQYVDMLKVLFYEVIESNTYDAKYPEDIIDDYYCVNPVIAGNPSVDLLKEFYILFKQDYLNLDLDGIVIEPVDYIRENVDRPKMKIAFKVNEAATRVTVKKVEWTTSRTGRIVPVVHFTEATLLSGAMVTKATGFNYDFINTNKIGPGSEVGILRAGEVIPYLAEVYTSSTNYDTIKTCPGCNKPIEYSGVDIVCPDPKRCGDSQYLQIEHWLKELGAEQVKEATLRGLDIHSIDRLYSITRGEIITTEGFGESSADIILSNIRKTLEATPVQLLAAIGITGIGTRMAEKIFDYIERTFAPKTNTQAFECLCNMNKTMLLDVSGIGDSVVLKLNQKLIWETYLQVFNYGFTFKNKEVKMNNTNGKLAGMKVAMTGNGPYPRKQLEDMISAAGGINGSVSKDTKILVCADPNSGSSKLEKARKFGTRIISYSELLELIK